LVDGDPLKDAMERGRFAVSRAGSIVLALARAVAHIHAHGVVHRDLKPGNVLLRFSDGAPVLIDFRLAALEGAARLTASGDILGTPAYMSPEQALGIRAEIDARTDVHALGAILFELLTGSMPFQGATTVDLLRAIASGPRPSARAVRPEVDAELDGIV